MKILALKSNGTDPVLLSGSLRFNLDPFDNYTDAEIWSALEKGQLNTFASGNPEGLQFFIAEGGKNMSWVPTYAFLEPRKQEVIVIQRKGAEFQPNECLRVSVARAAMNVMDAQKHFNRTDIKIHTVTIKMMKKPLTATSGKEKRPEPVPAAPKPVVVVKGAASATMISTIPTVAPGGPTAAKPLVPAAPAVSATKIQLVPVQVQMKPIQVPPAKSPAPPPAAIVAAKPPLVAVPPVLKLLPPTSPGPAAPVAAVAKPAPVPAPVPAPAQTPVPQPAAPVQTPCKCQHAQPSPVPAKSPAAPNQAK